MKELRAYHVVERLIDSSCAAVGGLSDGTSGFKQWLGLPPKPGPTHPRALRGFRCTRDQCPNEAHRR